MRKKSRYYLGQDVRNPLAQLWKRSVCRQKPVPSFPLYVQIQTITGCNATCAFCAHGKTNSRLSSGRMDDDLYKKIIDECLQHKVKRISPYLMNEPLLDKGIGKKIQYITDRKPSSIVTRINTNASLLKGQVAEDLLHSGLDKLHFSVHGISKEVYEKSMPGLKHEETFANINNFIEQMKLKNATRPELVVTMVRTRLLDTEFNEIKDFWHGKGVGVHIRPLDNQSNKQVAEQGLNPVAWHPFRRCKRLFTQAYILYNGDMVLCCVDWDRTTVLGNVREHSIEEIWNGNKAVDIRRRFIGGETEGLLCHTCCQIASV